eukprot:365813-Chlamydomonas_euryale.AAC.5
MPAASLLPSSARAVPSHLAAASTSFQRPASLRRRGAVAVAAGDAMCRDVVGQRTERESSGKTYKLTFLAGDGQTREAVCADNQYILDAAEAANIDLPGEEEGGGRRHAVEWVVASGDDAWCMARAWCVHGPRRTHAGDDMYWEVVAFN